MQFGCLSDVMRLAAEEHLLPAAVALVERRERRAGAAQRAAVRLRANVAPAAAELRPGADVDRVRTLRDVWIPLRFLRRSSVQV